jgi:hypothetical protein
VALGPEKSWVEFELFGGYPEDALEERIEIFDPVTRELRRASHYGWGDFERTGPRRYRISKGPNYRYRPQVDTERIGDLLVTNRTPLAAEDRKPFLVNLAADLGESTNVASAHPELVLEMKRLLETIIAQGRSPAAKP